MYVIAPVAITDSVLTASSLTETAHSAWASGTPYSFGDRVRVVTTTLAKSANEAWAIDAPIYWNATLSRATTTVIAGARIGRAAAAAALATTTGSVAVHGVFESVVPSTNSNTGNNPVNDDGTKWIKVGATEKFKPFDDTMSDPATGTADITFTLTVPSLCTGLALFGLAAASVTVTVTNTASTVLFAETRSLVSTESIVDWFTFFTWEPEYDSEALFTGLPAYAGYTIDIAIAGTEVAEIVAGRVIQLGETLAGTEIGFESFSRKDRDDWGNAILVSRPFADTVAFRFTLPVSDARRVKRVIASLESTPAVWFASADLIDRGATVYGFPSAGLRLPLEVDGRHFASLEIEGLT